MIIFKNPLVISSLDRSKNYPSNRKYSKNSFDKQKMYILNIFDDYEKVTSNICTDSEKNIDIITPT